MRICKIPTQGISTLTSLFHAILIRKVLVKFWLFFVPHHELHIFVSYLLYVVAVL